MYVLDIECYRNYFLMKWLQRDGKVLTFEKFNDTVTASPVEELNWSATHITFNGNNYDMVMWAGLMAGFTNSQLKDLSDAIIVGGMMPWEAEREFGISIPTVDHIDIAQVLPLQASLKVYGARINSKKLQDLPIEPDAIITDDQVPLMQKYCENDDWVTLQLFDEVRPQIDLRITMGLEYDLDLRSKSDAQIAEAVFASEHLKRTGKPLWKPDSVPMSYRYNPPGFIRFQGDTMQRKLSSILDYDFTIKASNGQVEEPDGLGELVELGGVDYQMGLGGLHSVDKPGSFYSDEEHVIYDIDVASYYPYIILNAGFYPERIGPVFLDIYRELVEKRIRAKRSGDTVTADSLKIVINGSFGKLGSKYSKIYSPDLMFHVTVTGQLALLMLIEQFPSIVVSANTDGITVRIPREDECFVRGLVAEWEERTGFEMEWNEYKSVHRRDVNNYLAVTAKDELKRKGIFALPGLSKNPANPIIYRAVEAYFQHGTPVSETIRACKDITQFIRLQTVRGGAVYKGEEIGKSVRWYRSWLSHNTINYKKNGNKVALSDNSVPVQDLPDELPWDVDHQWYINEANKLIEVMM